MMHIWWQCYDFSNYVFYKALLCVSLHNNHYVCNDWYIMKMSFHFTMVMIYVMNVVWMSFYYDYDLCNNI